MGVLKVWDGTDWRKVGCGGGYGDSLPVDFGGSSLGTGWVVQGGTFDVSGGEARGLTHTSGGINFNIARYDTGSASCDFTVHVRRDSSDGHGCLYFGYDPTSDTGYRLRYDLGFGVGTVSRLVQITAWQSQPSHGTNISANGIIAGGTPSVGTYIRVVYDAPSGVIDIYQDGVLAGTYTMGTPLTGTWVGFGTNVGPDNSTNRDYWGPGSLPEPGRLRLWTGTGWVRECCDGESGHPLKIEDPANPGTWITVACFTPV